MKKNLFTIIALGAGMCLSAQTPRLCLYEEFTGENCPPCATYNPALNALLALPNSQAKVVALKWEVPIPSAPSATWSLYKTNQAEIDWRWKSVANGGYGYGISSAPTGRMDGQNPTAFGAGSDHINSLNTNVINTANSYTSAFSIQMKHGWDATKTAVSVTVEITGSANYNAVGNLVFRCVMVEKVIEFATPPGTNGEKVFKDVAIKSYPTLQGGTPMASTWSSGQKQTFVLNCPVPSYIRKKEQIAMVGFIQDDGNRKVAQAVRSSVVYDAVAEALTVDNTCASSISPDLTILNNGAEPLTTMTITPYIDAVAKTPYIWTGNLAPGATTLITMANMSAPAVAGAHTFSFSITGLDGEDFFPANNSRKVTYMYGKNAQDSSVVEGFVAASYPPVAWGVINADNGPSWSRVANTGGYNASTSSTKYDFYSNTKKGDVDELMLPPINLEGTAVPELLFDYAYARRDANSNDKLEIFVSDNCGQTWSNVYSSFGIGMATTTTLQPAPYSPGLNGDHWSTVSVKLTNMAKADVLTKFVVTNDNGNNLYIDNINLIQASPLSPPPPNPTGLAEGNRDLSASVFPNPASGSATLKISSASSVNGYVSVTNALGQVVMHNKVSLAAGTNNIVLGIENLATGIYNVSVEAGNSSTTTRLTVNH